MSLSIQVEPAAELERKGFASLVRDLGWSGAVRFMHRYESGTGDYVQQRADILPDWDARELLRRCRQAEAGAKP
jgi:hypothetical protein